MKLPDYTFKLAQEAGWAGVTAVVFYLGTAIGTDTGWEDARLLWPTLLGGAGRAFLGAAFAVWNTRRSG